jgi:hypothetical protein
MEKDQTANTRCLYYMYMCVYDVNKNSF